MFTSLKFNLNGQIVASLSLVVILQATAHSDLTEQRRVLFAVLDQNQVAVLAAKIVGRTHEEDVSSSGRQALQLPLLGHFADVPQQRMHRMGSVGRQRPVRVALQRRTVEAAQLHRAQVRRNERGTQFNDRRRVLDDVAPSTY